MNTDEIVKIVISILTNKLKVNSALMKPENFDFPLTGSKFKVHAYELVHLFFAIEELFGIKINGENIVNYEFNTINGIVGQVKNAIKCYHQID